MTFDGWDDVWGRAKLIDGHYSLSPLEAQILWATADRIPECGQIVELGVCHGRMAFLLTEVACRRRSRYLGVDTWRLEGSRTNVEHHLMTFPQWSWSLLEGNTQDVRLPDHIHLLFIDAGHDEANIKPDCERWIPLVKPGGLVAFHDYDEIPDPASCHWAVRHYADLHTGDWPLVAYYGGLLIRRRP